MKKLAIIFVLTTLLVCNLTACGDNKKGKEEQKTEATKEENVKDVSILEKSKRAKDETEVQAIYSCVAVVVASADFMSSGNDYNNINNITFGDFLKLNGVMAEAKTVYTSFDKEFSSKAYKGQTVNDAIITCDANYKITVTIKGNEGYEDYTYAPGR